MVIRFDLNSEIPQNAEIKNALLSLFFDKGTIGNKYLALYRLTNSFNEFTTNWLHAGLEEPWDTSGGDYSVQYGCRIDFILESAWENYDVTKIVRQFVNGTPNYGFIIITDLANGNNGRYYFSSEYSVDESKRPKLTITYTSSSINNFTQYQNPLNGIKLRIEGSVIRLFVPFEKPYQVSLLNSGGRIIETVSGSNRRWYQLKTTALSNGIYFIQSCVDGKTAAGKVILME